MELECQSLVAFAGIRAEVFGKLVRHVHEGVSIGRCRLLPRDVRPNLRVLAAEVEPLFEQPDEDGGAFLTGWPANFPEVVTFPKKKAQREPGLESRRRSSSG